LKNRPVCVKIYENVNAGSFLLIPGQQRESGGNAKMDMNGRQ
jgi:hypothetical protein